MTRYATKTTAGSSVAAERPWRTVRRSQLDSWSYFAMIDESGMVTDPNPFSLRRRGLSGVCDCRERASLYAARWQAIRRRNSHGLMRTAHGFSPRPGASGAFGTLRGG